MSIRVALIGYGHLGKWHCEKAIGLTTAELVAIVDPHERGQKRAKEDHPEVKLVSNVSEIYNEIDAALVVSTSETHFEITKGLLEHGKHVFCEKPLCTNYDQTIELVKLAKEKSLILQVGHSERFHKCWELGNEKFPSSFEDPKLVQIKRVAPFKGRATDVDVVQDLMIHDIDLCLFLFKRKPLWVDAIGEKSVTNNWDYVKATIGFEGNLRIDIEAGRNAIKEERYLEIMNSTGWLHFDLFHNKYTNSYFDQSLNLTVNQDYDYEKRDHLKLEQEMFYHCIKNDQQPLVTGDVASRVVYIMDKILESVSSNKRIEINEK